MMIDLQATVAPRKTTAKVNKSASASQLTLQSTQVKKI